MSVMRPGFPNHHCAVGRLLYFQIEELKKTDKEPRLELCPQCNQPHKLHWYAIGWCDECAISAGYLPATAHDDEELLLFRAMFTELRGKGYDWPAMQHFAQYWTLNKYSLSKGEIKPWWISDVFDKPLNTAVCLWPTCGNGLGRKSVAGYCGTTCYQRAYRKDNKESIKYRKLLRELPHIHTQIRNE